METAYLKKCFGNCLTQALAEVAKVRPSDPIEFLAHWLYHYRKIMTAREEDRQEKMLLKEDYDNSIKESEMAEMMKQEEYQIQEQCAKCHKKDTERLKKEALKQESLPGTLQHIASSESAEINDPEAFPYNFIYESASGSKSS